MTVESIVSHIITLVVGLIGGYQIRIKFEKKNKSHTENTITTQEGNTVGGDQAGRDINKPK